LELGPGGDEKERPWDDELMKDHARSGFGKNRCSIRNRRGLNA